MPAAMGSFRFGLPKNLAWHLLRSEPLIAMPTLILESRQLLFMKKRLTGLLLGAAMLFALVSHAGAQPLALVNGRMLDVERRKVLPETSVLIEDGRIVAVGPSRSVAIPGNAEIIDCRGKWIMPGLVDAHVHLFQSGGLYTRPDVIDLRRYRAYEQEREWVRDNAGDLLARYLAAGITTIVDIGGPLTNYALRDRFNTAAQSPTILLTGPLISTWQPPAFAIEDAPILQPGTPEEARALVREQLPHRPDFIKIWYIVRPDLPAEGSLPIIQAVIDEAHRHELKVAVHASQLNTARLAVQAGADVLVHGIDDVPVDRQFIELLKQRRVSYIPTLTVYRGYRESLAGTFLPGSRDLALANPFVVGTLFDLRHLTERHGYSLTARRPSPPEVEQLRLRNLKVVHDAGINVATGTDAGNIGTLHASSYLAEALQMRSAGLDNWDVLRASTINGAKILGQERSSGSLVRGKRADVVILDRDPLQNLDNLQYIHRVINRGTVLDPATLIDNSPAALAQRQLNAYNGRDVEAFLEPYGDDVQVYSYPGKFLYRGKAQMREHYSSMFAKAPELHCELLSRIVLGNTVIDQERITGRAEGVIHAAAIYTVEAGKIVRVEFIRE